MNLKSRRLYKGIDCFKLIAAFGVIAIHTGVRLVDTLGRLGVPFFVIISSFFFFKHYLSLDKIEKKKYTYKYIKRLSFLFFSWELFYLPLAIEEFVKFNKNGITFKSILNYVFCFFYPAQSNANGWGPSWYLIAMIMAIPVFLLLLRLVKKNLILLGILCSIIEIYFVGANGYGYITHWSIFGTYAFPRILIYIYLGMLVAKNINKINKISFRSCVFWFGILILLFLFENLIIGKTGGTSISEEVFTTAPTAVMGSIVSVKWQPNISKTINIRNFSTFLYCSQSWGLKIWGEIIVHINVIAFSIVAFFFVVANSYILYLIYKCIRKKTNWPIFYYMV